MNKSSATSPPVPLSQRITWGFGSLGTIAYLNVVTALAHIYLSAVLKMDVALAGSLLFSARLVDAFSDPLMGWVTDHTKSRWGRRRPYLLLGAVVCGCSLPAVFSLHAMSAALPPSIVGVMAVLIVYSLGFTLFNIPYLTIPVEMTTDRMQRLSLMSYRSAFMMVGSVLGAAAAPEILEYLGGNESPTAYQRMGFIFGALVLAVMLVTFRGTRGAHAEPVGRQPRLSVWRQIKTVLENRPFLLLIGAKCTQFVALAVAGGTIAFVFKYVLLQPFTLFKYLAIPTTVTILVAIPLWRRLGRSITKRRGVLIGAGGEVLASLTWLLVSPDLSQQALIAFLVVRGIFSGFFGSAILLYSQAMWLDTIDHDQRRTGLRREGLYTSVYVFVERLGYSIGPLLVGFILKAAGFDSELAAEDQPASAATAIIFTVAVIPALAQACMLFFVWLYRLPEIIDGKSKT